MIAHTECSCEDYEEFTTSPYPGLYHPYSHFHFIDTPPPEPQAVVKTLVSIPYSNGVLAHAVSKVTDNVAELHRSLSSTFTHIDILEPNVYVNYVQAVTGYSKQELCQMVQKEPLIYILRRRIQAQRASLGPRGNNFLKQYPPSVFPKDYLAQIFNMVRGDEGFFNLVLELLVRYALADIMKPDIFEDEQTDKKNGGAKAQKAKPEQASVTRDEQRPNQVKRKAPEPSAAPSSVTPAHASPEPEDSRPWRFFIQGVEQKGASSFESIMAELNRDISRLKQQEKEREDEMSSYKVNASSASSSPDLSLKSVVSASSVSEEEKNTRREKKEERQEAGSEVSQKVTQKESSEVSQKVSSEVSQKVSSEKVSQKVSSEKVSQKVSSEKVSSKVISETVNSKTKQQGSVSHVGEGTTHQENEKGLVSEASEENEQNGVGESHSEDQRVSESHSEENEPNGVSASSEPYFIDDHDYSQYVYDELDDDEDFLELVDHMADLFPTYHRSELKIRIKVAENLDELVEALFVEQETRDIIEKLQEEEQPRVYAPQVHQLKEIFSDHDIDALEQVLADHNGDIELATNNLLGGHVSAIYERPVRTSATRWGTPAQAAEQLAEVLKISFTEASDAMKEHNHRLRECVVDIITKKNNEANKPARGKRVQRGRARRSTTREPRGCTAEDLAELQSWIDSNQALQQIDREFSHAALAYFSGNLIDTISLFRFLIETDSVVTSTETTQSEDVVSYAKAASYASVSRASRPKTYPMMGSSFAKFRQKMSARVPSSGPEADKWREYQNSGTLDLHHLKLVPAVSLTRTALRDWWDRERTSREDEGNLSKYGSLAAFVDPLNIITGRGLHSVGGVPVIRQAVERILRDGYKFEERAGSFVVLGKK